MRIFPIFFSFFLTLSHLSAQNVTVHSYTENAAREAQLLGNLPSHISFSVSPYSLDYLQSAVDTILNKENPQSINQKFLPLDIKLHPFSADFSFNSYRPFGWNNGSMISAKGAQTRFTSGFLIKSKILEFNLKPEIVAASNRPYTFSKLYGNSVSGPYQKTFLGQSYLNFLAGPISFGFSNENVWMGPGQESSLILSNNAPGFGHLHFSTRKPFKSPIGSFEFKFIAGGLDQDSTLNAESFSQKPAPFSRKWRYLSSVTFSYQPKPIPGLFMGFTRAIQFYGENIDTSKSSFFQKYLPAVTAFFAKDINTQAGAVDQNDGQDQVASVFMRYLMPRHHFEVYFEYGFNDFKDNTRDFIQDVQHSSAYLVGFKKMVKLPQNKYISINGELSQMAQSTNYVVRNANNWYISGTIKQGLSHMNQILGSGSGLGNNVQSLSIDWVNKSKRLGFKLQRIQNDPRALISDVNNLFLNSIYWNDFVWGPRFHLDYKNVLIRGELLSVHSKNYAWLRTNQYNMHLNLNLIYKW
jgi:hypothetical protein